MSVVGTAAGTTQRAPLCFADTVQPIVSSGLRRDLLPHMTNLLDIYCYLSYSFQRLLCKSIRGVHLHVNQYMVCNTRYLCTSDHHQVAEKKKKSGLAETILVTL